MSFFTAFFYDNVMKYTEEACLVEWRRTLLENVEGNVLEIGAGTGASLGLYPQKPSLALYLSEPDSHMRMQLEKKLHSQPNIKATVLSCSTENIDSDDDFFDYVFVSLVCCSVKDVAASLQEIKRVLKPTGRFIFLEHVAAEPNSRCYHWQQRLNFIWRRVADNCHLNRNTEQSIIDAGFVIEDIQYEKMRKMIAVVQPTIRGIARIAPE
ncbi:class I SAM-dependent methyltransferase [Photobacterium carnosum]|uniref:Methyltransferase type 11 n=1 Tax=Photobacterium carnosum TaxID=2023717 RepID=A0A2N4UQE6_9GAMM|nr:class I SAM-dependent methyltransferase [Photobacterium carnosum]MCD9513941.1 methyltransferase domain-containing protein [Photobacterium carnosum]MCD9526147.1 methyltransferase domain-containing protein [Photobacterium carnosum]MCD9543469.1 methyltransferase domain-containing protein [Photobacterium carnosum]PLC57237.1 methyltransferase type 11 [Photobacterium carnosum]